MAKFISNGPCDKCGSKDNRATYDDDSTWCWGCNAYTPPSVSGFVAKARKLESVGDGEEGFVLPSDLTRDFPQEVVEFIRPTGLTIGELIKNDYFWSAHNRTLLRVDSIRIPAPRWTEFRWLHTRVVERQGRAVTLPKSRFYGSKEDAYPITKGATHQPSKTICLTEDSLSAIKVGRVVDAMPLFGTSITTSKIVKLVQEHGYQKVVVWLDKDKFKEGWEIADKFKWLGCGAKVVLTQKDPKYYDEETIQSLV